MATLKKFRPLINLVLIERLEADKKSTGGINLPETSIGQVLDERVVACGPGRFGRGDKGLRLAVNLGDNVLLSEFGEAKIELEEKEKQLFKDIELLAKFE